MKDNKISVRKSKFQLYIKNALFVITFFVMVIILSSCDFIQNFDFDNGPNKRINETDEIFALFNKVTRETIKGNVTVKFEIVIYNSPLGSQTIESNGSGVIFYEEDSEYYLLTNNHVIFNDTKKSNFDYEIYDYTGKMYIADLLFSSADYDLAVLKFKKVNELQIIPFASKAPSINEDVIAIGQPDKQINAITFGKASDYRKPNCVDCNKEASNVLFKCLYHTAYISNGSSGGMLVNFDLQLVGINTFGNTDGKAAMAIPIPKIVEFLTINEFIIT